MLRPSRLHPSKTASILKLLKLAAQDLGPCQALARSKCLRSPNVLGNAEAQGELHDVLDLTKRQRS